MIFFCCCECSTIQQNKEADCARGEGVLNIAKNSFNHLICAGFGDIYIYIYIYIYICIREYERY